MRAGQRICHAFLEAHPVGAARVLESYPPEVIARLLAEAPAPAAALTLQRMALVIAGASLAAMPPRAGARIVKEFPLDVRVAVLRHVQPETRENVLGALEAQVAEPLRRLLRYPEGTVGELMDPFVLALPEDITVGEALRRARGAARGVQFHLFAVDRDQRLSGVVSLHDLIRNHRRDPLGTLIRRGVTSIRADTTREAMLSRPYWWSFTALPVVDEEGVFLGQIGYESLTRIRMQSMETGAPEAALDTVLALGELYWRGLSGVMEGITPGRSGGGSGVPGSRVQGSASAAAETGTASRRGTSPNPRTPEP